MNPLAVVGRAAFAMCGAVGALALFATQAIAGGLRGPFYPRQLVRQMVEIGFFSLPVVGLTAIFTGMVLALQSYTGFSRFEAASAIPTIVVLSMTRELGPVLAGLMVAGRVGAAMAAEIGTMRVTEQIDALTTLSTDPLRYLVFPRLLAGLLMLPLLVLVADVIGVMGGFLVSVYKLGFAPDRVHQPDFQLSRAEDVDFGPGEGRRVRLHRRPDGLLSGLPFARAAPRASVPPPPSAVVTASILILDRQLHGDRAVLQPMSEPAPKIAIRGLTKSFGPKQVLRGVDLDLPAGRSLVVIGGSGTGKSVLIKCVLGLIDAGQRVDPDRRGRGRRRDAGDHGRAAAKFGMLFQGGALFDSLPVWENVAFGLLATNGVDRAEASARRRDPGQVGLGPEVADLMPAELSGGMQKRVGLARAIAHGARDPVLRRADHRT